MAQEWFTVDKDGLREATGHLPPERLVFELIQNALDENSTTCTVAIEHIRKITQVTVRDDNPDGFKDLRDGYTLFRTTSKRADPTKRGRFNLGEKIVIARALKAIIATTKGTISFDDKGRHQHQTKSTAGSCITVQLPRWSDTATRQALTMLRRIYVPKGYTLRINHECVPHREPLKVTTTTLPTEITRVRDGVPVMTRTKRKTKVHFHKAPDEQAYLCEMGLPICKLDGQYDADVQQKVPQSQDRTLVSDSYLQDIYAEMLTAFEDDLDEQDLGSAAVRAALEDERVSPVVAKKVFHTQFGDNAVIQSPFDPDANQEAARAGATIVSGRTFGATVNNKLRSAGIQTTSEAFSRNRDQLARDGNLPQGFQEVKERAEYGSMRQYANYLSQLIHGRSVDVRFGYWLGNTAALYTHGGQITINVRCVGADKMAKPISNCTSLLLHELCHATPTSQGHDGVYDHAFERAVNVHTKALATNPGAYAVFEPELFS